MSTGSMWCNATVQPDAVRGATSVPPAAAKTARVDLARMYATTARVDLGTMISFSVSTQKSWSGTAWV